MTSSLQALFIACLMVSVIGFDAPASAQSPPTDLTELNIEEILALHIIGRSGEEPEDPKRWSVGYRYVYVLFDGNRDGTDDLSVEDVIWRGDPEERTADNFPIVPLRICQKAHLFDVYLRHDRAVVFVAVAAVHPTGDRSRCQRAPHRSRLQRVHHSL